MVLNGDPIDVLLCVPFPEHLITKLSNVSPRLRIHAIKASKPDDISSDIWAIIEILYTARVLPLPELAPNLRWIQFHFAGVDHVRDAAILQKPKLSITTLSGAAASQMAEYVLMMLLSLGHKLPELYDHQRRSLWPKDRWDRFSPLELRDSTVGIVGYGSIGRQVARLLHAFGATVLANKRDAKHPEDGGYLLSGHGDPAGDYVHRLYPGEALKSMVKLCDYLVICLPLTAMTHNLINQQIFHAMKPSAFLIDVSRGGVVDHTDLINALRDHKIAGASLDVFPEEPLPIDSPLWKMPNVVITPHISGNTPHYDERATELFIENIEHYLSGEELLNQFHTDFGY